MKARTDSKKEWCWFVVLWMGGLLSTLVLAQLVRWLIRI